MLASVRMENSRIGRDEAGSISNFGEEANVLEVLNVERSLEDGVTDRLGSMRGFIEFNWGAFMDHGCEISNRICVFKMDDLSGEKLETALAKVTVGFTWFRKVWETHFMVVFTNLHKVVRGTSGRAGSKGTTLVFGRERRR